MFELSATCFFFDVTATTEIYPYRHTPSLLDALPIASPLRPAAARRPAPGGGRRARRLKRPRTPDRADQCPCFSRPRSSFVERDADDVRSEEHTSELHSLMRISYAVFCLKKKRCDNILIKSK